MRETILAKRYALALAELASEQGILTQVEEELETFSQVMETTENLRFLLTSPTIAAATQHKVVDAFISQAQPAPVTGNLLKLLVDKRRMAILEDVVRGYRGEVEKRSGRLTVKVSTSGPLSEERKAELAATLAEISKRNVVIETAEDSTLLGGLVVQVGSVMMDYSLRNRLTRMKAFMKG